MKDYTEIAVVLDRSGSMASTRTDAEGGFNTFIEDQRKLPGKCNVSLMQFDTEFETVYASKPIADVPKLTLVPRNMTALYDAIGKTINELGGRLSAMNEPDRPEHVIVLIVTDGGENASREFTSDAVSKLIAEQGDKYSWKFVFIGANQDAIATAAKVGINPMFAMNYAANAVGTRRSYQSSSALVSNLRGGKGSQGFTKEDRDAQSAAGATT